MHAEAMAWVETHGRRDARSVLDIGGRNINGSPRHLFEQADPYRVLDVLPGDGVDIVAPAESWTPDQQYEVVVACEVFEHAKHWRGIVATAFDALVPGGQFIATMAGPGRAVHSGVDGGGWLHAGEHYGNVDPDDLRTTLLDVGLVDVVVDYRPNPADTRCTAVRPL